MTVDRAELVADRPASTIAADEAERLSAVRRYDILDTPPDGAFDRITAIAARRFKVPISIISIVDADRIWFKSHPGVEIEEVSRDPGLCASAILSSDPHILLDAKADPRSLANPLVAGEFGLRFYAGVPLRTHDGYNLGTLCVIDKEARPINQEEIDELKDLASVVMDQLELRVSARKAVARAQLLAREIDHRVMNSLQFVSSLLVMQSRGSGAASAAEQLKIAGSRVAAVARVHQHFQSDESDEVSCITYLRRLCGDLSNILGKPVTVDGDDANVPTTKIQPVGLIVNELVINAAKHGTGRIEVRHEMNGNLHALSVCDEGEGVPSEFDPNKSRGLGMKVVQTLARQLGGHVTTAVNDVGRRSCFTVTFPA